MTDRIRGSFTDGYEETGRVARDLQGLADDLISSQKGSNAEKEAGDRLREAYLKAGTNPRLAVENKDAINRTKNPSELNIEGAVIHDAAKGITGEHSNDGCPQYALLHGKMIFDHLARPNSVPAIWPKCEDGKLKKLEVQVPYGYPYDGPKTSRNVEVP